MGSNRVARQSFGMLKIRKDRILFELCLWKKKKKEKKEKERRKKMNKIEIFNFGFFKLVKG